MSISPYLGLTLYDAITDASALFSTYRDDQAGTGGSSNMSIVDRFANDTAGSIVTLQGSPQIIRVDGVEISTNYYEATVAAIDTYITDMFISLNLDVTVTGNTTLKINALSVITLKKINVAGNKTNIASGELNINKEYLFRYDGTNWMWVTPNVANQIFVSGTTGNFTAISSDGYLEDSGIAPYLGISPISISGSQVSHVVSGVGAAAYTNASVTVNAKGHITAAASGDSGSTIISGSDVMSDSSGSVAKHNVSGIALGTYNKVDVNTTGHNTSGSLVAYLTDAVISGSDVMSDTSGCVAKHNVSGVASGSYNSIGVNTTGHVTSGSTFSYLTIVGIPASGSAAGVAGQFAYSGSYIYICTQANTWTRAAIATW